MCIMAIIVGLACTLAAGPKVSVADCEVANEGGDLSTRAELFRIRIANLAGGEVAVSSNGGADWQHLGTVTNPARTVNRRGFAAARWGLDSAVAAVAVNAIHIKVTNTRRTGQPVTFSLYPKHMPGPVKPEYLRQSPSPSAIVTDIPPGTGPFGGRYAPYVGSAVTVQQTPIHKTEGFHLLHRDYFPRNGDHLLIRTQLPERRLRQITIKNAFDAPVAIEYSDGSRAECARVIRPVVSTGSFGGSSYAGVGCIRANHPGVIEISLSPIGDTDAFQIIPRCHAETPHLAYARLGPAWLIIGANDRHQTLAGTPPLFRGGIRPCSGRSALTPTIGQLASVRVQRSSGNAWDMLSMPLAREFVRSRVGLRAMRELRLVFEDARLP